MITGSVHLNNEAVVTVRLRGPAGATLDIQAVIDTGFNDWLTLSESAIRALQLPLVQRTRYLLADGAENLADLFLAEIQWHGEWLPILAIKMDCGPLLGMATLRNSSLRIDVVDGGRVEIRPIA